MSDTDSIDLTSLVYLMMVTPRYCVLMHAKNIAEQKIAHLDRIPRFSPASAIKNGRYLPLGKILSQ